jgi:hypothetical protein
MACQTPRSHIGVGQKKFKVPIVKKSSSYCWVINEQKEQNLWSGQASLRRSGRKKSD